MKSGKKKRKSAKKTMTAQPGSSPILPCPSLLPGSGNSSARLKSAPPSVATWMLSILVAWEQLWKGFVDSWQVGRDIVEWEAHKTHEAQDISKEKIG